MADTKKHWKEIVEPDDIDAHMVEAGQAAVNAMLVKKMISEFPLTQNEILYVPGCGTGQMFDFLSPKDLGNPRFLFADIKADFFSKLKKRLPSNSNYEIIEDDLEESTISKKADAALVVLILQHINWKLGLDNILLTRPDKIFLIEQEQDEKDSEINKNRKLTPSMKKFSEVAKTELVDRSELELYLGERGFQRKWMQIESVPYTKRMVALVFCKAS